MATPPQSDYLIETENGGNPVRELERTQRRHMILNLRKGGMTCEEISETLAKANPPVKMSAGAVSSSIKRYLEKVNKEDSESLEQLRVLENERLDRLVRTYWPKALKGELRAAQLILKISERRAKLNGLDSPQQHEHKGAIAHLHMLGVDVGEVNRAEEAFRAAFNEPGLHDPGVIDLDESSVEEIEPASVES